MRESVAGLVVVVFLGGCLSAEGRKVSQESIAKFAERQMETAGKIVEISRATPVEPELARLVTSMDEDAYHIKQWTTLTQSDLGRATGDVLLDDESQARARAMYETEIARRNAIRSAAARLAWSSQETTQGRGSRGSQETSGT
jgi:hypothetical protein